MAESFGDNSYVPARKAKRVDVQFGNQKLVCRGQPLRAAHRRGPKSFTTLNCGQ